MNDFRKYELMRDSGAGPGEVYLAAKSDGVAAADLIRLLRSVFHLSLAQAKEVTVIASGRAPSLDAHQGTMLPALEEALADFQTTKPRR